MDKQQLTYWMTLSQMPGLTTRRKNDIYVKCFNADKSIIQLFEENQIWDDLELSAEEKDAFCSARTQLTNNSFVVEDLLSQGYEIIPLHSNDYPRKLNKNLKRQCPCIMYAKGNKELLQQNYFTVLGSRRPDDYSRNFIENLCRKMLTGSSVLLSGYTPGTERNFLDMYLSGGGKAVIILPQGITKFSGGFTQYYKYVRQGKLLVASFFPPDTLWALQNEREKEIIRNMADAFFIVQSKVNDSNWLDIQAVQAAGKSLFVRYPQDGEKNSNMTLIQNGGHALNMYGDEITVSLPTKPEDEIGQEENLLF